MNKAIIFILISIVIINFGCSKSRVDFSKDPTEITQPIWKIKTIPPSPQDWAGDAAAGLDYLWSGAYVGSGVPFDALKPLFKSKKRFKDVGIRVIDSQYYIPKPLNVFTTKTGVKLLVGTCFTCHYGKVAKQDIIGVANASFDFSKGQRAQASLSNFLVKMRTKKGSEEREAYADFGNYFKAIVPAIKVNQAGNNPAFRLAEACVQHRNPETLAFEKKERFKMTKFTVGTDVPPLWNVKKKNALYYNGMGRGDFTKLLMQSTLLGVTDTTQAREIQQQFRNVMAWLKQLEAPKYPYKINKKQSEKGKVIFHKKCSSCHGKYDEIITYPNKVVALHIVKTDPYYAYYIAREAGFTKWYNESWFAVSKPKSSNIPLLGYIAPPLDGIWASAPYLHNGAIPNLTSLLNSQIRPKNWGYTTEYDQENVGIVFTTKKTKSGYYYKSDFSGQSNKGHYFGDALTAGQRADLLEYLKTL